MPSQQSRFSFELATAEDDAALRRMAAETALPGQVRISLRREPNYLHATEVEGGECQVLVARDLARQQIVGMGCRSVRSRYVNGTATPVGYLGGLRVDPSQRGRALLARGYQFLRELHLRGPARMYLTTISDGNQAALGALVGGRAGLPAYHYFGRYHSFVVPRNRRTPFVRGESDITVRPASEDELDIVVTFLNACGRTRQFFPVYDRGDFFCKGATFRDLRARDLYVAWRGDTPVGALAAWDQSGFRQVVVEGYQRWLQWLRPVYNRWAAMFRRPIFPVPGGRLRYLTAALPLAVNTEVFEQLLDTLLRRGASEPCDCLLVGMHETDPLYPTVRKYAAFSYVTELYIVCWDDGEELRAALDDRPVYLELGCL